MYTVQTSRSPFWDAFFGSPAHLRQEMESYDCRKDLEDWHGLWTGPKKARESWSQGRDFMGI